MLLYVWAMLGGRNEHEAVVGALSHVYHHAQRSCSTQERLRKKNAFPMFRTEVSSSLVTAKASNPPFRHALDTPRCLYRIGFSTEVDAPFDGASMVAVDGRRFWMTVVRPEHRSREADAAISCLWHLQPGSACPQLPPAARCVFLFIFSVFFCCHRCCSDAHAGHTSAQV